MNSLALYQYFELLQQYETEMHDYMPFGLQGRHQQQHYYYYYQQVVFLLFERID
jgi:hypothetical protein